jgi:hypothetical protein
MEIEGRSNSLSQQAIIDRVQGCLAVEVHMYVMASAVSAHMRSITKSVALSAEGCNASPEAFLHCGIQGLRVYFPTIRPGDKIDPQILVDMIDLFRAECFARRTNAGKQRV